MNKGFLHFISGATLEITEENIIMTSTSGVRTKFDKRGNFIGQESVTENNSNLKYFFFMGEAERATVKLWLNKVELKTKAQTHFLKIVKESLVRINYDYWISIIEPSCDEKRKIFFAEGRKVARGFSFGSWENKAKEFCKEKESRLANLYELFCWYGYRIAMGNWSLEYVCDDSSDEGNYCNSPYTSNTFEVSGSRMVGGFSDGTGNTCKIVTNNSDFVLVGGYCNNAGDKFPVADVAHCGNPLEICYKGTGVIVLKK